MLDANETFSEAANTFGKPIKDSIYDLIETYNLKDTFMTHFGRRPPTTTNHENRPIDIILTHGIDIK